MLRSYHSISSVISVNATTLRSTLIDLKRNNPGYTITPNALDMEPFQGRYISLNGLLHKPKKKRNYRIKSTYGKQTSIHVS